MSPITEGYLVMQYSQAQNMIIIIIEHSKTSSAYNFTMLLTQAMTHKCIAKM